MEFITLVMLGISLSMDAFSVAVCKGLAMPNAKWKNAVIVGLWFGGFQALMPLIGFMLGAQFRGYIEAFDHWIAFVLLAAIGINMIRESFSDECDVSSASLGFKTMFIMSVATSIDALAAGVALAMDEGINIFAAVSVIGCTTFILSAVGVKIAGILGDKFKNRAVLVGGIVLILLGVKILLEHLAVI